MGGGVVTEGHPAWPSCSVPVTAPVTAAAAAAGGHSLLSLQPGRRGHPGTGGVCEGRGKGGMSELTPKASHIPCAPGHLEERPTHGAEEGGEEREGKGRELNIIK